MQAESYFENPEIPFSIGNSRGTNAMLCSLGANVTLVGTEG
jgi:hypothetical protein